MANDFKLTSIEIKSGELDQAKAELNRALTELWNNKVESHYISLKHEGTEYWLRINTKNLQVLYSADRTALLPFLRAAVNNFFADKVINNQSYFKDIDLDQRLNNTNFGTFVFDGSPQQRLSKVQIEKAVPSLSRHGLFSHTVQPEKTVPDTELDKSKQGPQHK